MQISSSDKEDYYTIDGDEMQPDPVPKDHDLLATPKVNYSGNVNVPTNEVNRLKRLPVDMGPLLESFLSSPHILIDPASCETAVSFNHLFGERMWTSVAKHTNIYARSKIRTADQGMNAIDAMTHFSHDHHAHHNTWRDVQFSRHKSVHGLVDN